MASYDPFRALTFHDATARLRHGKDSPRADLERCVIRRPRRGRERPRPIHPALRRSRIRSTKRLKR